MSPGEVLIVLVLAFLLAQWRVADRDARYWRGQAERYQRMWDEATWKKPTGTADAAGGQS